MIAEHRNGQGFMRLYPLRERMAARPALADLKPPSEHNALLEIWLRERCTSDPGWC